MMREDYSTEGKNEDELKQIVEELSSKLYRLEREKSLLRRVLEIIRRRTLHRHSEETSERFEKKTRAIIHDALLKTDARQNSRKRKI